MDAWLATLLEERQRSAGPLTRARHALDLALRTTETEHVDDPTLPEAERQFLTRYLDLFNRIMGAHRVQAAAIRPLVERAVARRGVARVLELACGSGEAATTLARHYAAEGLPVEVLGTDRFASFTAAATRARRNRWPVRFQTLDALHMGGITADVVLCAGSLHHFAPGALARLLAGAAAAAREGVVATDGRRSLTMLGLLAAGGVASGRRWVLHDALVSARRFYSEVELAEIAALAAPGAAVTVRSRGAWSRLSIDLDAAQR